MWMCPTCERVFKTTNQSHSCTKVEIDDLFEGRPLELSLAFDGILYRVMEWQPNHVGTGKKAIIFTNKKAWLIITPMSKELDVKFYLGERLQSGLLAKISKFNSKFAHHIRINSEEQITPDVLALLRLGYEYGLK